jgi:hypothetical protein
MRGRWGEMARGKEAEQRSSAKRKRGEKGEGER